MPLSIVAAPTEASAQGWLKDRRYREGIGIKTGDFELHPGIGAEVGYDSNWFLRTHKENPPLGYANGAPGAPVRDAALLRITPSFSISTLGQQRLEQPQAGGTATPSKIAFTGGVAATYREFFGHREIRDQRNISGDAYARLDLYRGRPVGFGIFANYQRLIQPSVVADPNLSFNRSDVGAGAEVIVIPGGGTLDLRGGYQVRAALFEESNGVPYSSLTHLISVRNRWRFRPRTALFHDTGLSWVTYPYSDRAFNYLNDSTPVRTSFGITGLITERIGALASVGYGATFFRNPEAGSSSTQFDSLIAQAELTYYVSPAGSTGIGEPGEGTLLLSTLSLGYLRQYQMSLLGNFYEANRGYARAIYAFGGKAVFQLDGFVEGQSYPEIFVVPTRGAAPQSRVQPFTNIKVGASLFAEYRFSARFGLNTTIDYAEVLSDTTVPAGATALGAPPQEFHLAWRRFQAFLGARYFF